MIVADEGERPDLGARKMDNKSHLLTIIVISAITE
jgi:hypothetical protein